MQDNITAKKGKIETNQSGHHGIVLRTEPPFEEEAYV